MIRKIFLIFLLVPFSIFAQDRVTLSGYIKDASNGEDLIAANVFVIETGQGTVTNVYGFYSLTLPKGTYKIRYSYLGYVDSFVTLHITQNITKNVELKPVSKTLETAEVRSTRGGENIESTEMSSVKLDISTIQKIPALLGEVDLVRAIQLLPGVTTVGEGATGFNVRGGGIDQNLVLLDEAPVFNSAHLFGFFSVFNPDAVKDVKLIKGGIPSNYGGRLSSILDVRMKEGNSKEYKGTGGVGLIFSRFAFEGPIKKDKSSFIVAGRRSYIDVLAKPFLNDDLSGSQFYFYDFTAKANYTINKSNKIYASGYFGRDVFGAPGIFGFDWGNQTATVRLNSLYSSKLFSNVTAYYSKYDYELRFGETDNGFNWKSNIINYSFKPEFTYYIKPELIMNFGGQSTFYTFIPGTATTSVDGQRFTRSLDDKYSWENGVYVDFEQKVSDKINLRCGLRYSHFHYLGKGTAFYFNDTTPNIRKELDRTETFDRLESITDFGNFEPRFALNYVINKEQSVKWSYNRMTQYIHLISNTTASVPLDVWTPSTNNIPGQIADQVAVGYFRNFKDNEWETSVETYYKDLKNQVDYIDGANLLLNEFLEADLLTGIGRAYGAEFYIKRNRGKLTGWVSYTLARSERRVEGINSGEWFPVRFDRAHNLNVVAIYTIPETRWSFSGNFVYYTGTPATFPTNKFMFQGYPIPHNDMGARNNYRLPAFHRLDLSATLEGKKGKKWESEWVFSVYNVYGRRNPFSIFFQPNPENFMESQAIRFAVLGTAVPAVTYNFKF
jgi:hypothetical protein